MKLSNKELEEFIQKKALFITELTYFGQPLHVNDILPDLREIALKAHDLGVDALVDVVEANQVAVFGGDAEEKVRDARFDEAVQCVKVHKTTNAAQLREHLKISHGRASALIDQLEEAGIIGPAEAGKPRKVL